MSISRLFFCTGFKLVCSCTGFKLVCSCTGFKLVCSTYYYHHHHQLSYGYVSTLLTPPKGESSK
jgi:hypothetical protein